MQYKTSIKYFYQNNFVFFTLKSYYIIKLYKDIILFTLYYTTLVCFFILSGGLLDGSLKDFLINCDNKELW
jgi:hypothetical protein